MGDKRKDELNPPIMLDYTAWVLEWAPTREPVLFKNRTWTFIGNERERLGKVPYLAICKNLEEDKFMLCYCNEAWEIVSPIWYDSIEKAKKRAEIDYQNISQQWIKTNTTEEQAKTYLVETYDIFFCSFCGKRDDKVERCIFRTEQAAICNECIEEFYNEVKETEEDINKDDNSI